LGEVDINPETEIFIYSGTIKRTLKNSTKIDTQMKFYKTVAIRSGLYGCGASHDIRGQK
jgi:hypothetical protein